MPPFANCDSRENAVAEQAVPLPYSGLTFVFQPPFVMEKWIVGITENQTVECTVTYEVSLGRGWGGVEGSRSCNLNRNLNRNLFAPSECLTFIGRGTIELM